MSYCLPVPLLRAAAPDLSAVTLRYRYVPGKTLRYRIHIDRDTSVTSGSSGRRVPLHMTMDLVTRQMVQKVRTVDGAATLVGAVEELHVFSNGKETEIPKSMTSQMKLPYSLVTLPDGKVLSLKMPPGIPLTSAGDWHKSLSSSVALPERPVKIGESWPGNAPVAGVPLTMTYTLTGFEAGSGTSRAIIQQKTQGIIAKTLTPDAGKSQGVTGTVTGNGTYVFDRVSGCLSRLANASQVAMTLTPTGATPNQETRILISSQITVILLDETALAASPTN